MSEAKLLELVVDHRFGHEVVHARILGPFYEGGFSVGGAAADVRAGQLFLLKDACLVDGEDLPCNGRPIHVRHAEVKQDKLVRVGSLPLFDRFETPSDEIERNPPAQSLVTSVVHAFKHLVEDFNVHLVVVADENLRIVLANELLCRIWNQRLRQLSVNLLDCHVCVWRNCDHSHF